MEPMTALEKTLKTLWPHLDERSRRLVAAAQASARGHGGITEVSRICGLSRVTITKGIGELDEPPLAAGRIRKPGAGRNRLERTVSGVPLYIRFQAKFKQR